jgi:hypothetical protein
MPEVVMKILADQPLAIEPKDSSDLVDLNDGTGPLEVLAGTKVKTGAKDSVKETVDGREITWVFVEAIEGDNADKKKGFVSDKFLVAEGTAVPMSEGFQPFSTTVEKSVFAEACYVQAALNKTNPAYLYALAFALSGNKWSATQVQTSDPAGVFRFPKETWQSLLSEPEAAGFQANQIKFPTAQCVVAAIVAAKSANLLQGLITDRGLSAVDLFLSHLFADEKSFGSNAAARILQAERDNKGQTSEAVIKAEIYPDSAAGGALRTAFFQRNVDIFNADGSATIEQALKACTDKLAAGFAAVAALAKDLDAEQNPNLEDCQVAVFGDNVPENPRAPVLGGGGGGASTVGGRVIESQQHATRNKRISQALHDILEFAGRMTGIDVEIYSGGQPRTGPNRIGTHRHDIGPGLMGAADLHMLDARTGRILNSDNQDDRKRMAIFMAESAAAGATGIGHAPGYMGSKSTHIGGGSVAVWGTRNSRAGAPDWVIAAFEHGRAHPLTEALASALSSLRSAPIQTASSDNVKVLAGIRQRFASELQVREIHRLVAASTAAEVGGQGPKAEQYYIESVFNRAAARNMTLKQTLTSDHRYGGYYPPSTINRLGNTVQPSKQAQIDQIIARVMAGANESNFATGNESESVHSGGAPVTRDLGPQKERFVQEIPDRNWIRKVALAAARGNATVA